MGTVYSSIANGSGTLVMTTVHQTTSNKVQHPCATTSRKRPAPISDHLFIACKQVVSDSSVRGFSHIHEEPRSQVLSRSVGSGRREP